MSENFFFKKCPDISKFIVTKHVVKRNMNFLSGCFTLNLDIIEEMKEE